MSEANKRQVAGNHYEGELQHWDIVVAREWDYFQAQISRYLDRWKKKNGLEDLYKAQHYLQKYIELAEAGELTLPIHNYKDVTPKHWECNCHMCRKEREVFKECDHTASCTCKECWDQAKRDG